MRVKYGVAKNVTHPTGVFPAEVARGDALPSCFSSHTANKCPFHGLFTALFVHAFVLFVWCFAV